jgi:choline-sulfatase
MIMEQKPNILFLMTDQQRLDYVGFSKQGNIETPNIDRLAESVGFTNCQTVNPICTPARTALITGRYPHQIGTLSMSGDLSRQIPTYMQALQRTGYYTAGIGKFHYLQTWPWSQDRGKGVPLTDIRPMMMEYGYDVIWESSGKQLALKNYCDYCEHMDQKGLLEEFRDFVEAAGPNTDSAHENTDMAAWPFEEEDYVDVLTADKIIDAIINRPKDKPFFVYGSFSSPHKPYDPPQRYLDRVPYEENDDFILSEGQSLTQEDKIMLYMQRRAAKAMVLLVDDQIGRILKTLEDNQLLDKTVILFTSDHGDMLGDHERLQKGIYWKQSCTVPTAIRHPEYLHKKINSSPVEITDLTATILELAGLDPREALNKSWPAFYQNVPCKSVLPIVRGEKDQIREFSFSECSNDWEMIQTERYKYVLHLKEGDANNRKEEFYDLHEDPKELQNKITDSEYKEIIQWCRNQRTFVKDNTPPVQTSWAPLIS